MIDLPGRNFPNRIDMLVRNVRKLIPRDNRVGLDTLYARMLLQWIGFGITRGSFGDGKKTRAMKQLLHRSRQIQQSRYFVARNLPPCGFCRFCYPLGFRSMLIVRAPIAASFINRQAIVVELTENLPKCSIQNIFQLVDFV